MPFEVIKKVENAHEDGIWGVAWKKDKIVTASLDSTAKTWHSDGLKLQQQLNGHMLGIISVAIDSQSKYIVTSSMDSHIKVWNF